MRVNKRIVIMGFLISVILLVVADQTLKRNLKNMNFGPLSELFKARLGEAVTVPAVAASGTNRDALLFETYGRAYRVAAFAREQRWGGTVPESADALRGLASEYRSDAWGHPFCLEASADRIAVFSAGPGGRGFSSCNELFGLQKDISGIESSKLYEYPSGRLVMVVPRQ